MKLKLGMIAAAALISSAALAQNPQGAQSGAAVGATTGAVGGAIVGGPIGAVVGGVGGAIIGGAAGNSTPQFQEYVVEQRVPSYTYQEDVAVGAVLPQRGVVYREIPQRFVAQPEYRTYRYTVVNGRTVIVDPTTRRIVQVIE